MWIFRDRIFGHGGFLVMRDFMSWGIFGHGGFLVMGVSCCAELQLCQSLNQSGSGGRLQEKLQSTRLENNPQRRPRPIPRPRPLPRPQPRVILVLFLRRKSTTVTTTTTNTTTTKTQVFFMSENDHVAQISFIYSFC